MSQTDDDLDLELPSGVKVKLNLTVIEWIIICFTITVVAYFYNS